MVEIIKAEKYSDAICVLLLIAIWMLAVSAVNPVGNFPLNDDWAYASAVRELVEQGRLRLSGWTATNLVAQMLWGALFCLPFGFSFTALRASTLVLAILGTLATYGLLREAQAKPEAALIGAAVFAFNPIYFALSFTFMTDVPFTAVVAGSSYLLLRGLRRNRWAEIVAGLALAMVAILIRQIGLAIPIAFAIAYVVKRGFGFWRLIEAVIPVAAGFAVQAAYQAWLHWLDRVPANFGAQISHLRMQLSFPLPIILTDAATVIFYSLVYTGLLLFPFLIYTSWAYFRSHHRIVVLGLAVPAAALAILLKLHGTNMPFHGNVLTKGGIGPSDLAPAPSRFWLFVTFLSCFGAMLQVAGWIRAGSAVLARNRSGFEARHCLALYFAVAAIIVTFAPMSLLGLGRYGFYDRYLIVFLPWLMLLFVAGCPIPPSYTRPWPVMAISVTALVAMADFSVLATHDYLAVNRTRWIALRDTMRQYNVGPEQIDGGFEFNGWYLYDDNYVVKPDKSWWWVLGDAYVVGVWSGGPDYVTLAEYPVDWWLPWCSRPVLLQHRNMKTDSDPVAGDLKR